MKLPLLILAIAAASIPLHVRAGANSISIQCTIGAGKTSVALPAAAGSLGAEMQLEKLREVHYPNQWNLPAATGDQATPLTPSAFGTLEAGWTIHCAAARAGNLIRLTGIAKFTAPEDARGVYGEQSGTLYGKDKLVLSENKSPTFVENSSSTPFQINLTPGKQYEIRLKQLDKWVPCTISCKTTGQ